MSHSLDLEATSMLGWDRLSNLVDLNPTDLVLEIGRQLVQVDRSRFHGEAGGHLPAHTCTLEGRRDLYFQEELRRCPSEQPSDADEKPRRFSKSATRRASSRARNARKRWSLPVAEELLLPQSAGALCDQNPK